MKKWLVALLASGVVVLSSWLIFRDQQNTTISQATIPQPTAVRDAVPRTSGTLQPSKNGLTSTSPSAQQSASNSSPTLGVAALATSPAVEPTFESTNLAPVTVLENMRTVIRQYGIMFGGNPVGTNPEITKALQGDNPKQINFLKADGNRVNANGELVDPWGTPYFFHQLSGAEMEIRSAGPDRVMYTTDDLVIK